MDKKLIFNEHGERGTQSMIGGNTTNLREWSRIKYDWANQMYRTMLNNFWIPEEISLNEDVKQVPYLTDYERRAFDKIIAFKSAPCYNGCIESEYTAALRLAYL